MVAMQKAVVSQTLPMSAMMPIVDLQIDAAHLLLIKGDQRIHKLAAEIATKAACIGKTVHYICGDNWFDPYAIARAARITGKDNIAILQSIFIVRAFTAYQMHELVMRIDHVPSNRLVIIANPCATFFDDDVELTDAARYFYRMLGQIDQVRKNGRPLMVIQTSVTPNRRREYFLRDLKWIAHTVVDLGSTDSFLLESRSNPSLPPQMTTEPLLIQ